MESTLEERKKEAIKCLKQLNIYKPYIEGFEKENDVCYFERFAGYWAYQEPDLIAKIQELEKEYNLTVYAITHEVFEFGDCYSFLCIPNNKEDWEYVIERTSPNSHYVFAYVWNLDDDYCSEFGTISVQSFGGGIRRNG